MNSVQLIGRFTRDPDIRYTDGGLSVARFTLAVDRAYKKDNEQSTADFISCVAFGKSAEFIEKYFFKGNRIGLNGRIQTGNYTNKDGVKVYTTDVVVEHVEFVESKASSAGGNNYNQDNSGRGRDSGGNPPAADQDGFMNIPDGFDEELPF